MTTPQLNVETFHSTPDSADRLRWVASLVLIWLGVGLAVGGVMAPFVMTWSIARGNGAVVAIGYVLYVTGWLLVQTAGWRRAVSTTIATLALLLVMHSFGSPLGGPRPFQGLDVMFGLAGGELPEIVHPFAAVMVLAAWFIARTRSGWSYLLLPVVFIVHLIFTLADRFPWSPPLWDSSKILSAIVGPQPFTSVAAGFSYGVGPVLGWALLLGGAAWVSGLVIDARWVPAMKSRPARVPIAAPATAAAPAIGGQPAVSHTNTLAILALVFGIAGGILGIIFGHLARAQIRRTGEEGWGMATAGLVLGYIGTSLSIIVLAVYVIFFVVLLS